MKSATNPNAGWLAAWKRVLWRTEEPSTRSEKVIQKVAGVGILLAVVITPFLYWHDSQPLFNPDPYTYAQQTKEVLQGKKLYTEVQFDKGPLAVLVYAIPEMLTPRWYPTVGAFLGIYLGLQALAFVWVFRNDLAVGLACTLVITLIPLTDYEYAWMGTEHASNPFVTVVMIVAICIARSGRFSPWQCILAGMFTCFAMNVRQTALMTALVPATAILCTPQPWIKKFAGAAWSVLGGVVGLMIVLLWVWLISDIPAYLQKFYLHPATYAGIGTWTDSWHLIRDVFATPDGWLGAGAAILALGNLRRWNPNGPLVLAAIAAGLLAVALPHREYPHYWMGFIPNLALIVGVGLYPLREKLRSVGLIASIAILCLSLAAIRTWYEWSNIHADWVWVHEVADAADQLAPANSTLLVWGPIGSEAIVFASRQPEANPNWILWMLDPPRNKLLPIPVDEIEKQYLQHPPSEIAADTKWMTALQRGIKEPEKLAAEFHLARLLFAEHTYEFEGYVDDYSIYGLVIPSNAASHKDVP